MGVKKGQRLLSRVFFDLPSSFAPVFFSPPCVWIVLWNCGTHAGDMGFMEPFTLLPLLPLRGGKPALRTGARTTPRKERRRVGVGESERTQTRAPPQQGHQARLLPPLQARRCS